MLVYKLQLCRQLIAPIYEEDLYELLPYLKPAKTGDVFTVDVLEMKREEYLSKPSPKKARRKRK